MKLLRTILLSVTLLAASAIMTIAQETAYRFETVKKVKTTPVKDQQRTGTCWSYAATSFLETEVLRMGKPQIELSPMFFAKQTYANKAHRYVRFQGANNFGQGGQAHDVMAVVASHGVVPQSEFSGMNYGEEMHVHSELEAILNGIITGVVKNPNRKLSTAWQPAYYAVLDAYLGENPTHFSVNGKSHTPISLRDYLGIDVDSYIYITSYTHHPFYKEMILEIPDNWAHQQFHNLPMDELMEVMNYAIDKGFSICWDGDVSEKGFAYGKGLAVLPQMKVTEMKDSEQSKWADVPQNELATKIYSFNDIVPEIEVTQALRQTTFDDYTTTDDHLMHIVGISKDQNGNLYYITKNSWGSGNHVYDGYLHMSEAYVKLKTVSIMVHKDAIPKKIAKKMGI